jgi:hypothetical protein
VLCAGLLKNNSADPRELLRRSEFAAEDTRKGLAAGLSSAPPKSNPLWTSFFPSLFVEISDIEESEKTE